MPDDHRRLRGGVRRWRAAREVTPIIQALRQRFHGIADEEVAAALHKFAGHQDAELDQKILFRAIHRVVHPILHDPVATLRRHGGDDAARVHASALRKLFNLNGDHDHRSSPPALTGRAGVRVPSALGAVK